MPAPQSFKHHTRWDPGFHFFIAPLLLLNLVFAIWYTCRHYPFHFHVGLWTIVMSIVLLLLAVKGGRANALAVQDRLIRLEERLRLTALGVPTATVYALTEDQLIGLRFASDVEAPALAELALRDKLDRKQIKAKIQSWKADNCRV